MRLENARLHSAVRARGKGGAGLCQPVRYRLDMPCPAGSLPKGTPAQMRCTGTVRHGMCLARLAFFNGKTRGGSTAPPSQN